MENYHPHSNWSRCQAWHSTCNASKLQEAENIVFILQFSEIDDESLRAGHIVTDLKNDTYSLKKNQKITQTYEVEIVRIAQYINEVVATRKIPNGVKGTVVMKLDVEVNFI